MLYQLFFVENLIYNHFNFFVKTARERNAAENPDAPLTSRWRCVFSKGQIHISLKIPSALPFNHRYFGFRELFVRILTLMPL